MDMVKRTTEIKSIRGANTRESNLNLHNTQLSLSLSTDVFDVGVSVRCLPTLSAPSSPPNNASLPPFSGHLVEEKEKKRL